MPHRWTKPPHRPISLFPPPPPAPPPLFALEPCEPRRMLATYYVSPTGNDANAGTSSAFPFKTIAKVNTLNLDGGDSVLFQGGATFTPPAPSSTNQVTDPGFESGNLNNWTESFDATAGNSTITSLAGNMHSGTKALRVGGSTAGGRGQIVTSKLKSNTAYLLKFWAKLGSGSGDAYVGVNFYRAGVPVAIDNIRIGGTSYKQYSIAFLTPGSFDAADVTVTKNAGTSVLCVDDFTLNQTYSTMLFDSSDSGTAASPVTIGSYGSGKATINAGDASALIARDVAGFVVEDLNFVGTWDGLTATGGNGGSGVVITNDLPDNAKLDSIRIDNVDASKFKWAGISVSGDYGKAGFTNVSITNSSGHDNGDVGIRVEGSFDQASTLYSHSGVYVGWCKAYNNGGIPYKGNNSGNGILVGDIDGGVVERCVAWNNGALCNNTTGGPIGIWAWDSNNVTLQYNESYANKTGSTSLDGGGFDLDGGCTNSVLQYNYAHDNYGAGYLLYQFATARPFNNNTVRYNISQNDGRDGHYGGVYMGGGSAVKNSAIYNNTIYLAPGADPTIAGIKMTSIGSGNIVRNNIIQTAGGARAVDSQTAYSTATLLFQGNDYYPSGSTLGIKWGSTTVYTDLSSWRATGQEKNGTSLTGSTSNPQLVAPGTAPTLGDASKLHTLTNYQLLETSPMIDAGITGAGSVASTTSSSSTSDVGAFTWSPPNLAGGNGNDSYLLRLNSTGNFEMFVNTPITSVPTIVWAKGVYSSVSATGGDGDDTFTLDLSNGNPLPSGGVTFDGGNQIKGDFIIVTGTAGNDVVAVSAGSITPGGSGPSLKHSGVGSITFDGLGGSDTLNYNNTPGIGVTFKGTGSDTLNINSGTFTFSSDAKTNTPSLTLNVASGATALFNATQHLSALNVNGKATLGAGGDRRLVVKSLSVAPNATLDLNDNTLIVDYALDTTSPIGTWDGAKYTGITGMIASGRNGGAWIGKGITSTSAANAPIFMGLAVGEASDVLALAPGATGVFDGETVDASSVVVRYTYVGDGDLNGAITSTDFYVVDSGLAAHLSGYLHGDFDYNGRVDGDDQFYLDSNFADQFYFPLT